MLLYENYGDNINDFGTMIQTHGSGSASLYLDSGNIVANVSNYGARCAFPITPMTGLCNIEVEIDTFSNNANLTPGFGIIFDNNNMVDLEYFPADGEGNGFYHKKVNGTLTRDDSIIIVSPNPINKWIKWKHRITPSSWEMTCYDANMNYIASATESLTDFTFTGNTQYGIFTGWWSSGTLRWDNIKVTRL